MVGSALHRDSKERYKPIVWLGYRLLLPLLGLVGLVLWLVPGLAFTKYHCEFVNLFCIYWVRSVLGPKCLHTAGSGRFLGSAKKTDPFIPVATRLKNLRYTTPVKYLYYN